MSIQLIVNADDYGHTTGVSAGIRQAHLQGIVTSTTAMMNHSAVDEAIPQAQRGCPQLGLGVHLVLTSGSPLLPASQVPSLVDEDGQFFGEYGLIARLTSINPEEVRREWRAQVEKFVHLAGCAPDHIDSHHHASYFTSDLFRIQLELAREHHCAIRVPLGQAAANIVSELPPEIARRTIEQTPRLLSEFEIPYPGSFLSSFYDETVNQEYLLAQLDTLSSGVTELMCHPGLVDAALLSTSTYLYQRETELAILTSPAVAAKIRERGIQLVSFGQISPSQ